MTPQKINLAMELYERLWRLAMPLLRHHPRLQEGFDRRCSEKKLPAADIWIQAASAGEAYLAVSLIEHLNPAQPTQVLVTTNTRQGFDIINTIRKPHTQLPAVSVACDYIPFDRPRLMETAVEKISPKVMVLLETEIWPGLLYALKKRQIKTVIINGRLTPKSLNRYLLWPTLWQALRPDRILAISDDDANRFAALFGRENVQTMPNIKFDRLSTKIHEGDTRLTDFIPGDADFLVLGSVREPEENQVEQIIRRVQSRLPETVVGLFPRHMQRIDHWTRALDRIGIKWQLRSALRPAPVPAGTVILWDIFGELNAAYALAGAVFVGGSLAPLGGQNFLEPMIYGITPVIGPSWENFAWAGNGVFDLGLAIRATNWKSVASELVRQLQQKKSIERQKILAKEYIEARQGGTLQACRCIMELLNNQENVL